MAFDAANRTGRTVVGLFRNRADAEQAITDLKDAGFTREQIGIAIKDRGEQRELADASDTTPAKGAAAGAVTGGLVGGIIGLLGSLLVPGLGPIVVGGVLESVLVGAGAGAATGGIIGALVGGRHARDGGRWGPGERRRAHSRIAQRRSRAHLGACVDAGREHIRDPHHRTAAVPGPGLRGS